MLLAQSAGTNRIVRAHQIAAYRKHQARWRPPKKALCFVHCAIGQPFALSALQK
jgi:hypothetical protein